MNLFAFRKHIDKVLHPIVSGIASIPIHANTFTLIGALLGLAGGAALFYGWLWSGLALLIVRGVVDHVDGYKARNYNQRSTFGAVMDDVCDRWVLGIMYAGGCLFVFRVGGYWHALILMAFGITGALVNVIIKLSIYAESPQDIFREKGKIGHPVDNVGAFGSAEFIIYFGAGILVSAIMRDERGLLVGCWIVAVMSHLSLLQRILFARKRYRHVDPGVKLAAFEKQAPAPEPEPEADPAPPAARTASVM